LRDPQSAGVDPAFDAALPEMLGGVAEHALEENERGWVVLVSPREVRVELLVELVQSESLEVVAESLEGPAVSSKLGLGSASGARGLGHGPSPWVAGRDQLGSASYIASSRGSVRLWRTMAASLCSVASATYSSSRRGAVRAKICRQHGSDRCRGDCAPSNMQRSREVIPPRNRRERL
jgi:hypothetical protein